MYEEEAVPDDQQACVDGAIVTSVARVVEERKSLFLDANLRLRACTYVVETSTVTIDLGTLLGLTPDELEDCREDIREVFPQAPCSP
jgi:hypothetical protein